MTFLDFVLKYWPIVLVVGQVVVLWAAWSIRQAARNEIAAAVSKLETADQALKVELDDHGDRLLTAEGRLDGIDKDLLDLPTKADVAKLSGEIAGVGGQVASAAAGVARLEGFFLQKGVEAVR